jgi:nitric oxide reductase NorE protein
VSRLADAEPAVAPAWKARRRVPGLEGFWAFALVDLLFFGLLLGSFVRARAQHLAGFEHGQAVLVAGIGFANLMILLTSSWFAAVAVQCLRRGEHGLAGQLLRSAAGCGAVFAGLKIIEYSVDLRGGLGSADGFFTYYFVLTGLHFVHVVVGTVVLLVLARGVGGDSDVSRTIVRVETGTAFWHLVDLLWVVIFPTLYLAR